MSVRVAGGTVAIAVTAAVAAAAAVGVAVTSVHHGATTGHPSRPAAGSTASPPVPAVRLSVVGARHGRVPPGHLLRLRAADGSIVSVSVRDDEGRAYAGRVREAGSRWVGTAILAPSSTYHVTATVLDVQRHRAVRRFDVASGTAPVVASTAIAPLTGRTVGVGQPLVVRFSHPVDDRVAAERGLQVATSQPVTGAWHWMSSSEVHFRPRAYWPAGVHVVLDVRLARTQLAHGTWGEDRTVSFSVGSAHVSTVDVAAHTMTVRSDGRVLRVLKVSTGRDKYPTRGGVHLVIEKQPKRVMDSATVGIPKGDPDYYRETVLWDVRISYGGAFVHAAPWSVADQGVRNVSHGCVNLSLSDARWFYGLARPGDVVDVVRSAVPPDVNDPGMADWNMSWKQWLVGSATGLVRS
ncbi:MAG: Ig-like domain-containing protein [Frankiaceae bacterium]